MPIGVTVLGVMVYTGSGWIMANDRIFIECRHCNEKTLFAKYYPSNYGVWDMRKVASFIDEHMGCNPNVGIKMDLNGDRCFNLWTENANPEKQTLPKQDPP